jgi:EF-P beta-lysylation protein EpmB
MDRMELGNPRDPLLLQVLPDWAESNAVPGYVDDPLAEHDYRRVPGLLHKYQGRALLITTGSCPVHCRYCFRRHYPYSDEPRRPEEWEPALQAIAADESIHEVLLSGGDPLMLPDSRLQVLCDALAAIPHLSRLRVHTRMPIVLPSRVTAELIATLRSNRLTAIVVVHANHAHEIAGTCARALREMVEAGLVVLNQSVLLRGVNDSADALEALCERLIDLGVIPYYLHQLDAVRGAAHFECDVDLGRRLVAELRERLPGYAVPRFVREIPGEPSKLSLA